MSSPLIQLRGVERHYGEGETLVRALDDVDVSIGAGELVVVLGPSGSGKTTLLNVIGALDSPTAGQVLINGRDISSASRRELFQYRRTSVSFVFQTFNLFPTLTAIENVQFGADVAGRPEPTRTARAALDDVGLTGRVDHFPHQLSGGEQQRVAIARALATGNPILLADEPTGELDYRTGAQILALLEEQTTDGRAVVIVTHNREISRVADRVVELSGGKIHRDGPPEAGRLAVADLSW